MDFMPARASCCAQASPAGSRPTTSNFFWPVFTSAGSGLIQPFAQARSTIAHSMVLIVTDYRHVQRASGFARCRTNAAGELRKLFVE